MGKHVNRLYDRIAAKTGVLEKFTVIFACTENDRYPFGTYCTCYSREHVENIVKALGSFNSGDECECLINGRPVELDQNNHLPDDWAGQFVHVPLVGADTLAHRGDLF